MDLPGVVVCDILDLGRGCNEQEALDRLQQLALRALKREQIRAALLDDLLGDRASATHPTEGLLRSILGSFSG